VPGVDTRALGMGTSSHRDSGDSVPARRHLGGTVPAPRE